MKQIKNLILDMDGVLWRGETPMPGLADFFVTLRRLNINFVLATNNATKTAVMYAEKLAQFGVQIPPPQILTSAETTALYLSQRYEKGTAVYVIGEKGLHDALIAHGFHIITPQQVKNDATAPLVVAGFTRNVTYPELAMGSLLVHKGATFIGTNPDPTFPSEIGPLPGAGSLQAVVTAATGVQPDIIGKPSPIIFQEAVKRLGGTAAATAMVGDRLTTDIKGGNDAGLNTILLLSGISSRDDIVREGIQPDFIFQDIADLAANLAKNA
ncbi:MAG: HAD-IIA family hydrolase [Chloroflexi bacterium]|nr:HAD-IIA family hydrolase [Chloroflexota bacterium]